MIFVGARCMQICINLWIAWGLNKRYLLISEMRIWREKILLRLRGQNLFIAMTQKDLESLQNNPVLFNVTKQYLQFLMVALEKRVAIEEAKKLNDTQILDFLMKQNKLKVLKDILDKETARIKRLRPDIVKSWKSYQAFEKLCKDNNIA